MIQFYSLMWVLAVFFAVIGFLRGWNRELVAMAGILAGAFVLFQFDPFFRGTLLLAFPREQAFIIQIAIFLVVVFFAYQNTIGLDDAPDVNLQTGILGAVVGFFNGYLIGGTLWYFVDINEYPLGPQIIAPGPNSPSAGALNSMPLVIASGGVGGSGDFLLIAVVLLILVAIIVL